MRTELAGVAHDSESLTPCPCCGHELHQSGATLVCMACAAAGRIIRNVIDWREEAAAERRPSKLWRKELPAADNARRLIRAAMYCLHPVASPLSPLAWLTRARLGRYYERTRRDPAMAQAWAAHYLADLPHRAQMSVLDHGAGRGRNLGILAQLGFRIAAQDVAPHEDWLHFSACEFQVVPPNHDFMPWRAASFDLVLDWMVLEHFPPERLQRLAGEVARVLTSGGHWHVVVANDRSFAARAVRRWYGRLHSCAVVEQVAQEAGMSLAQNWYEGFRAPLFPIFFDAIRKNCAPWPIDLADYRSALAKVIPARRRAVWVAAFRKP